VELGIRVDVLAIAKAVQRGVDEGDQFSHDVYYLVFQILLVDDF
jgi:hypothetical protein